MLVIKYLNYTIEDETANFYYVRNPQNFIKLVNLIITKENSTTKWLSAQLRKPNTSRSYNKEAVQFANWIISETKFIDQDIITEDAVKFSTRIWCMLKNIYSAKEYLHCKSCGNLIKNNSPNLKAGLNQECCCRSCHAKLEITERIKKTGYAFSSPDKIQQTKLERYGDPNWNNTTKRKQTLLETYGYPNYNNAKQISQTLKNKSPEEKLETNKRKQETFIKNYGVDNPAKSLEIQEKTIKTNLKRYGKKFGFDYDKIKERNNENFGYDWPLQSPEIHEKSKTTWIKNYGVDNPMKAKEIQQKAKRKYQYLNIQFDSIPELAVFIYLTEHNIPFKYHSNNGLPYIFAGSEYQYFHDFDIFLDGKWQMVEIKGAHFFKEDGTMFNPYRNKDWSDEQYEESCAKYEAKHQCMIANGVQIWLDSSDEVQKCIDYVKSKHGKNFFKTLATK